MSSPNILDVQELCTAYGRSQVLFDVNLLVRRASAVAVLGRNGAGKTTLMKSIVGELTPNRGRLWLDGDECTRQPTERRIRNGLAYVPQEHAVFGKLTVRENLAVGALHNNDSGAVDRVVEFFPKLGQRFKQAAGTLSGGERKMLAIGRALLSNPKVLLLDEPTEGVWVGVIEEIGDRLLKLAEQMSVVIVEQHLELALKVADHAYVMDRGRIALEGSADTIKHHPELLRYLAP